MRVGVAVLLLVLGGVAASSSAHPPPWYGASVQQAERSVESRWEIEETRGAGVNYTWKSWAAGPPCPQSNVPLVPYSDFAHPNLDKALKEAAAAASSFVNNWQSQLNSTLALSMVVVYQDTVLLCEGWGHMNKSVESPPPTCSSIYRWGSITKIFTSLMMMQALEKAAVSLSDPLTHYFSTSSPPEFNPRNPYGDTLDGVTLQSLAQHTSGVPREVPFGLYSNATAREIFFFLNRSPLLFPPFSQPHYSNLGSSLLGRALERALGVSYEQWVQESILDPIGMSESGFDFPQSVVDQMPVGYSLDSNGVQIPLLPYYHLQNHWPSPSCGLRGSMQDFGRFMRHIFNASALRNDRASASGDSVLSGSSWNQYLLPGFSNPDGISGFGLATFEQAYANGFWIQTKGGLLGGFGSTIAMVPQLQLGVAAAVNMNTGTVDQVSTLALNALVPALLEDLAAARPPHTLPQDVDQWLGSYGNGVVMLDLPPPNSPAANGGFLVGSMPSQSRVLLYYDLTQSTSSITSLRYWAASSPLRSCISLDSMGTGGVMNLRLNGNGERVADVPDMSMWGLPLTPETF